MSDNYQINDYQLLLAKAARFYEKYEVGRPEPFNVFSVLRKKSDEVNLHSRFLHALLDYKKPGDEHRENVKDFLQHVGIENFDQTDVKVDRERYNIDLLITNNARQAVVIENKIWAQDQPKQLQRYHKKLKDKGYDDMHLLYLTLYGSDPSENSIGDLDHEQIITISYRDDLPPWLERCQKRACDEPELRESLAQYLRLVKKQTKAYMNELKKLLLQDDNLVLAHELNKARIEIYIALLHKLWCEIESELEAKIPDLPTDRADSSEISEKTIRKYVTNPSSQLYGLLYRFDSSSDAKLAVRVSPDKAAIRFGVSCKKKEDREKFKNKLEDVPGMKSSNGDWVWYQYADGVLNLKYPTIETFKLLSTNEKRQKYVAEIACGLKEVWKAVKVAGLDKL